MKKSDSERDPNDPERRRVVKGGLLAAATALGFLPACSDAEAGQETAATSGGAPAAGGGTPPVGGAGSDPAGSAADSGRMSAWAGTSSARGPSGTVGVGTAPAGSGGSPASSGMAAAGKSGAAAGGSMSGTSGSGTSGAAGSAAGTSGTSQPMTAGALQLPRAMLGKTGVSIPIVGLGTSRLGQRGGTPNQADFDNMVKVFTQVLDLGIEYVDTGANYGRAEEALGIVLQGRRDKVFLVTKLYTDSYSEAERLFERSLSRLKTDHVDLLHLHSAGERNIDTVLSQNGSWRYIQEQKAKGRARFCGITGHSNPPNFIRMLETDQVDVLMTIMNFVDHSTYGFSKTVREEAMKRGLGIMAMKIYGGTESVLRPGGGLANSDAPEPHPSNMQLSFNENVLPDCMRFAKGLGGITGMVIGVNFLEEAQKNIRWAMETQPFSPTEMEAIIKMGETVAPMWAQRYG
jgi:predicted aldo/keto reductase-like oxidoreductase